LTLNFQTLHPGS